MLNPDPTGNPAPPDAVTLWKIMIHDPTASVVICDIHGKVLWGNARCFHLYLGPDATPEQCIGRTWDELGFPKPWIDERLAMFREMARTREPILLRTIWRGEQVLAWVYPVPPEEPGETERFLTVSRVSPGDPEELAHESETKVMVSGVARLGDLDVLSPRELEVLALLGQGLSIKEIAGILFRSEKTIGRHRDSIGAKLGLRNKVELADMARRAGLKIEDVGRERV